MNLRSFINDFLYVIFTKATVTSIIHLPNQGNRFCLRYSDDPYLFLSPTRPLRRLSDPVQHRAKRCHSCSLDCCCHSAFFLCTCFEPFHLFFSFFFLFSIFVDKNNFFSIYHHHHHHYYYYSLFIYLLIYTLLVLVTASKKLNIILRFSLLFCNK